MMKDGVASNSARAGRLEERAICGAASDTAVSYVCGSKIAQSGAGENWVVSLGELRRLYSLRARGQHALDRIGEQAAKQRLGQHLDVADPWADPHPVHEQDDRTAELLQRLVAFRMIESILVDHE